MSQEKKSIYRANIADPDLAQNITEVVFAPGCFDDFQGTQEELDELVAEIHRLIASGEFLKNSQPLDEEDFEHLAKARPDLVNQFDLEDQLVTDDIANRSSASIASLSSRNTRH